MQVLLAADHSCCMCRAPGADDVQIHHIDENPRNNDSSNLAVLCLSHHSQAHTRGGFGRHLDARHITHHRDTWDAAVRHRRSVASDVLSGEVQAAEAANESLLVFLRKILTIDFSWEGSFRGEFGEFSALEDEEHFQLPGRESLKTKPRLFHTYWGLVGSRTLTPDIFREQAISATQRLTDRLSGRRWIETHIPDYQASPIDGIRPVRSVRHTAKAASILLLTGCNDALAGEILWNLVAAADDFMNEDGGCREEFFEQPSSTYASGYMLQLLAATLADARAPMFVPEFDRWAEAASGIVEALHGYMAASWEATRWAWGDAPWEVNAPYIIVDTGPWLQPRLRSKVSEALRDELTPVGRLKSADLGNAFGAPEPIRALRVAYALRCANDIGVAEDHRLSQLCAWLVRQDWGCVRLRPCDVAFLARIATVR